MQAENCIDGRNLLIAMKLGERIQTAIKRVGTQKDFEKVSGIAVRTLSDYINDYSSPKVETLQKIADLTSTDLRWLIFGDDHIPSEQVASGVGVLLPQAADGMTPVPVFQVRASAGNGLAVLSQAVDDWFSVPQDFLTRLVGQGARVGAMQAVGDSMEPNIRDGDLMLVRFDISRIREDGVYVVSYDGEIRVKRLTVNMGEVVLSSDNPRYKDQRIARAEADERLIVHGMVFWTGGVIRAGR